ncbi:MAG: hypothetical protein JW798_05650, partial [Prolixibacteraceae bacterium]|nr:hypothetical protein [Prolixibacteraceae bacterium]
LFFHEVLWNSHEKYKGVMSNSRSRYAQMHLKSNFWTEVFPLFTNYPNHDFYCFSGDMGGNTDAVSLFYDKLENVSLIASGMGEVPDENFLKVNIGPDTVVVEIIPLNDVQIFPIEYYSVPARPESVFGPVIVVAGESGMFFSVDPVFNATSYRWELPPGIHGYSDVNEISLSFDQDFIKDTIRVSAIREGFGESLPARLVIGTDTSTTGIQSQKQQSYNSYRIFSGQNKIFIYPTGKNDGHVVVSLLDVSGRILLKHSLNLNADNSICLPQRNNLILIIESKQGRSVYKIWAD